MLSSSKEAKDVKSDNNSAANISNYKDELVNPPDEFICPITSDIMRDPVITAEGHSYERAAIERWFNEGHHTNPVTNLRLAHRLLVPNIALRNAIQRFVDQQPIFKQVIEKAISEEDLRAIIQLREKDFADKAAKEKQKEEELKAALAQKEQQALEREKQLASERAEDKQRTAELEKKLENEREQKERALQQTSAAQQALLAEKNKHSANNSSSGSANNSNIAAINPEMNQEVFKIYKKAVDQNDAEAQYQLGHYYIIRDEKQAVGWYEKAAKQNHAQAQLKLGAMYLIGRSVAIDTKQAVEWFEKAAKQNHNVAQYLLGLCYEEGDGIAKDEKQAVEWYEKAAKYSGDVQYRLGLCYEQGIGVAKNEKQAMEWYEKAAARNQIEALQKLANQNNAAAQNKLGRCYEKGDGIAKDKKQAVEWYRKAAEQGHVDAQYNLGSCYFSSYASGVEKDVKQAVKWYRKAAEQGHAAAQYLLGNCYYYGHGVAKDEKQAVEWYKKAAALELAGAHYDLGNCYYNGSGVAKDEKQAFEWYHKAATRGYVLAQKKIADLNSKEKDNKDPNPPHELAAKKLPTNISVVSSATLFSPKIKQEPASNQRLHPISDDKLREVAIKLRGSNNSQDNCAWLLHDLIKYFETGVEPNKASQKSIPAFTKAKNKIEVGAVIKKEPGSDDSSTFTVATSSTAVITKKKPHNLIPPPEVPYEKDGSIDPERVVIDIESDNHLRTKISHQKINNALIQEAKEKGGIIYGEICSGRINQHIKKAGHKFAFYATSSKVTYIDPQFYDGKKKTGAPIFYNLADVYGFITGGKSCPAEDKFGDDVFYLIYGSVKHNDQPTNNLSGSGREGNAHDTQAAAASSSPLMDVKHHPASSFFNSRPKPKLTGTFKDKLIEFEEHEAKADGNCGFHSLGVHLDEVINTLLRIENDNAARKELAVEIAQEAVAETTDVTKPDLHKIWNHDPVIGPLITAFLNERQDSKNASENRAYKELLQACATKEVYRKYVNRFRQEAWLGCISAKLVAQYSTKPFNLYIWEKDSANKIKLKDCYANDNLIDTKHILYTNGYTHFNLLAEVGNNTLARGMSLGRGVVA